MVPYLKSVSGSSSGVDRLDNVRAFCAMIPAAACLWNRAESRWLLNDAATSLTNYSQNDYLRRPSLWLEGIHPEDREMYCAFRKALVKDRLSDAFDYRIVPRNARGPKWIRERSLVIGCDQHGDASDIISLFTDISDLKRSHVSNRKTNDLVTLSMHELQNRIHKIAMELELLQFDLKRKLPSPVDERVVESLNGSLAGLRNQVLNIVASRYHDPLNILNEVMRKMRKELVQQRVNLRLVRNGPVPVVEGERDQFRDAFERVVEYCGAMLKDGGDLRIETGPKEVGGETYAQVRLTTGPDAAVEIGELTHTAQTEEGHCLELGISLATEILGRYQGRLSFRRMNEKQGQVTILLKGSS